MVVGCLLAWLLLSEGWCMYLCTSACTLAPLHASLYLCLVDNTISILADSRRHGYVLTQCCYLAAEFAPAVTPLNQSSIKL